MKPNVLKKVALFFHQTYMRKKLVLFFPHILGKKSSFIFSSYNCAYICTFTFYMD